MTAREHAAIVADKGCLNVEIITRHDVELEGLTGWTREHSVLHNDFASKHCIEHDKIADAFKGLFAWKNQFKGAAITLSAVMTFIAVACAVMTYFNDQRTRNIENEIRTYSALRHSAEQDNKWGSKTP